MILDLVSPWCAAVEAKDSQSARAEFRARHAELLEQLRLQRSPESAALALATDPAALRALAARAADPQAQGRIRELVAESARHGADGCRRVVFLAGPGIGEPVEPLPMDGGTAAIFLEQVRDDIALTVAIARAAAALTRWSAADSESPLRERRRSTWDRWQRARDVALREWLYAEALGAELARLLLPEVPAHAILGVNRTSYARLRRGEKTFRALLAADLDRTGIGPVMRWLHPAGPRSARTIGAVVLPPMAGRYLATKVVSERVARVGLRAAIRMAA